MSVEIRLGDVREVLRSLPADYFDIAVTSPPYWGLRDYGVDGQIGLEPTLAEHLAVMVEVFGEVRRVLKPEGTLWVNYGDCYATSPNGRSAADQKAAGGDDRTFRDKPFSTIGPIYPPASGNPFPPVGRRGGGNNSDARLKPKDLCMVPNRLAIALQEDGWWVRSEIIWAKPNPMPESVHDRPATAHEKIFMLSRAPRYFYDAEGVRQGRASNEDAAVFRGGAYVGGAKENASLGKRVVSGNKKIRASDVAGPRHAGGINHTGIDATPRGEGRNLRNYEPAPVQVWPIATRPFSDAHFATFPPELVERCLKAGCPAGGRVLDPFGGAGTTGVVAEALGLDCTLIELNPEYAELAERRLAALRLGPASRAALKLQDADAGPLFSNGMAA